MPTTQASDIEYRVEPFVLHQRHGRGWGVRWWGGGEGV